jgi:hypothetical protein
MAFRRVLGAIGRHPAAGVWAMAPLLLPLAYLLWLRSEPAALWALFGVIVATGVLQLPASVAGFWVTPLLMQLAPPHDERALVRLLTWQWGITAILNYVIWGLRYPCFRTVV